MEILVSRTILLLSLVTAKCLAYTKIDLEAAQWTVKSESQSIEVPATVPGGVYTDLMNAGILTSPFYYRSNDDNYRWVAYDNWTYSTTVELETVFLQHDVVVLECEGLDAVATIFINGIMAGTTENMFRRYSLDIKDLLKTGTNDISVSFESPVHYAQRKFEEQENNHYIVPPECVHPQFQGECHANHIRKMQASFSWDWGPAFPSMGIWQPISLEAYDSAVLRYVKWNPKQDGVNDGDWKCNMELIFDIDPNEIPSGTLKVQLGASDPIELGVVLSPSSENPKEASVEFSFTESSVSMWYPNEEGPQTMYDLKVEFVETLSKDKSGKDLRVAFRSVELIQEPLVQGLSYKFRINGQEMFMKGSNWIPAHVLPEQVTREYIFDLLYSAKEAHNNMLRVWGGGIYELNSLYEIADELGILIWQDFMFACSMYQANPENLANADKEVQHQIRRLQYHPSIALWAGNNENEKALRQNWYGTDSNFDQYKSDYIKLYVDTAMRRAQLEDPDRPFIISSPNNGDQSISEGFIALDPGSSIYGDKHFYDYSQDNWDYRIFPKTRFGSEYGFQSFPSFEIIEPLSEPFDWSLSSDWTNHRMRHPNGINELKSQLSTKVHLPSDSELDTPEGFREFIFLTNIYQSVALKTESEHYRREMTSIDPETGEGQCMGALYWQLNDIWPGPSWSSIEHGGKWKMSHYVAEKMFRKILVSPILTDDDSFQIHLVSDYNVTLEQISLEIAVMRWDSFTATYKTTLPLADHPARTAAIVASLDFSDLLVNGRCTEDDVNYRESYCFIIVSVLNGQSEVLAKNEWMPYIKTAIGLTVPNLEITSVQEDTTCSNERYPKCFSINIATDAVAPFVWIEAIGVKGHFSDNGILMSTRQMTLRFYSLVSEITSMNLQQSLQVRSYMNSLVKRESSTKFVASSRDKP